MLSKNFLRLSLTDSILSWEESKSSSSSEERKKNLKNSRLFFSRYFSISLRITCNF